jgi:hypothetical protein
MWAPVAAPDCALKAMKGIPLTGTKAAIALGAVRMERHVHSISMIEPKAVMGCCLTKGGNRQPPPKCLQKELLDF